MSYKYLYKLCFKHNTIITNIIIFKKKIVANYEIVIEKGVPKMAHYRCITVQCSRDYRKRQKIFLKILLKFYRSLGNRKNYVKSSTTTLQGNDVRVDLCLPCIIIFAISN
jgi:hypothetical protein